MTIARLFAALFLLCCFGAAGSAARADALDDTLALFLDDKFPQTEKAIGQLAVSGAPTGTQILEALADNRLFIDKASHVIVFKNAAGDIFSARTGEKASKRQSRRAQEGARQQRVAQRHRRGDGLDDARLSRSGQTHRGRRRGVQIPRRQGPACRRRGACQGKRRGRRSSLASGARRDPRAQYRSSRG